MDTSLHSPDTCEPPWMSCLPLDEMFERCYWWGQNLLAEERIRKSGLKIKRLLNCFLLFLFVCVFYFILALLFMFECMQELELFCAFPRQLVKGSEILIFKILATSREFWDEWQKNQQTLHSFPCVFSSFFDLESLKPAASGPSLLVTSKEKLIQTQMR